MCGISALFSDREDLGLDTIKALNETIKHRGPDDEGYMLAGSYGTRPYFGSQTPPAVKASRHFAPAEDARPAVAALGHRRLAIIDASPAGHQPMSFAEQKLWVVYNGEIYNYIELRTELQKEGIRFETQTDTEVLLAAYFHWGESFLSHLNGMFSFVLYDQHNDRIMAARDRFGIKPLYLWRSPKGQLAFASEIKQFTCLPGWKARLNPTSASDFLNWGLIDHTAETMFADVFQLRGGQYICGSRRDVIRNPQSTAWYALPTRRSTMSVEESSLAVRELLEDSIRLRLRADVPVGSCLSGGIDSSTIVCILQKFYQTGMISTPNVTISAFSEDPQWDESHYARLVADRGNTVLHGILPDPRQLFARMNDIIWQQDEPFPTTSIFAQWSVFARAKEAALKVMLDGQGADELFMGYPSYAGRYMRDLFTRLRWIRLARERQGIAQNFGDHYGMSWFAKSLLPEPLRELRRWLNPTYNHLPWFDFERLGGQPGDPFRSTMGWPWHRANAFANCTLTTINIPQLLHWEDRNSMSFSIESRVPFLDYRLVELAMQLPENQKIRQGLTKYVLREATRGLLPEAIRMRRDKIGFRSAEEHWATEQFSDYFVRELDRAVEISDGLVRPKTKQFLARMIAKEIPYDPVVWRAICFGGWLERFSVT